MFPDVRVCEARFVQRFSTDGVSQSTAAVCKVLQALQYKTLKQAVEHQAVERKEFFMALFAAQQAIKAAPHVVCAFGKQCDTAGCLLIGGEYERLLLF